VTAVRTLRGYSVNITLKDTSRKLRAAAAAT
jgi:hypothetical protein